MSEEMARKKAQEIEELRRKEDSVMAEIKEDMCPCCGLATKDIEFFNVQLIKLFGWVECSRCGNVYCPKSVLKQKGVMAKAGLAAGIPATPPMIQPA